MADFKDITWVTFNEYKQIDIFGNSLFVPIWTKCIEVSPHGDVWAWSIKPDQLEIVDLFQNGREPKEYYEGLNSEHLGEVSLNGVDWKECIFEI